MVEAAFQTLEQNNPSKLRLVGETLKRKAADILNYGKKHQTIPSFHTEDAVDTANRVETLFREKTNQTNETSAPNFSAEFYTPRASLLNVDTNTHQFNTGKSVRLLDQLVEIHGFEKAKQIAIETYTKDIHSLVWEIIGEMNPYHTKYKIIREQVNGEEIVKLVHESDLAFDQKDILDKVTDYRRGKERFQVTSFKEEALNLKLGQSIISVSPVKAEYETEAECSYKDTIKNIGKLVQTENSEGVVEDWLYVDQYITKRLKAEKSADFLNNITGRDILPSGAHVDRVLETVEVVDHEIGPKEVWKSVGNVLGIDLDFETEIEKWKQVDPLLVIECRKGAERLLEGILAATHINSVDVLMEDILKETLNHEYKVEAELEGVYYEAITFSHRVDEAYGSGGGGFSTSCGNIGGGGRGALGMMTSSEDGGSSEGKKGIKCGGCGFFNLSHCLKKDRTCHQCSSSLG